MRLSFVSIMFVFVCFAFPRFAQAGIDFHVQLEQNKKTEDRFKLVVTQQATGFVAHGEQYQEWLRSGQYLKIAQEFRLPAFFIALHTEVGHSNGLRLRLAESYGYIDKRQVYRHNGHVVSADTIYLRVIAVKGNQIYWGFYSSNTPLWKTLTHEELNQPMSITEVLDYIAKGIVAK